MSFFGEKRIKATRKPHTCAHCNKPIPVGSPANYCAGLNVDGDFDAFHGHIECREAEVALNRERGFAADEWDWLWNFREDDDAEEWAAWLRKHHPIAAERIGA